MKCCRLVSLPYVDWSCMGWCCHFQEPCFVSVALTSVGRMGGGGVFYRYCEFAQRTVLDVVLCYRGWYRTPHISWSPCPGRENQFVTETQQLVDLGKQMNLVGEDLREFVWVEHALAREEMFVSGRTRRKMKRGLLQKQWGLLQRMKQIWLLQWKNQRGFGIMRRK